MDDDVTVKREADERTIPDFVIKFPWSRKENDGVEGKWRINLKNPRALA
jgi:hypothetical protein